MRAFRMAVVAVVIAAIFSPAMGMPPVAAQQAASTQVALGNGAARAVNAQTSEGAQYAQREQQSQGVRDFRGGAVYVYFGSGVVLALIIIILLLL